MSLKQELSFAVNEKDVENIYRKEFLTSANVDKIISPCNVDGIMLGNGRVNTLLEFKYDLDLKQKTEQCKVLIQVVYYLKALEGDKNFNRFIPSTIFIGDRNECFVLHTNKLLKYLTMDLDWSIAPSKAYKENPELLSQIIDDEDIAPYVFNITDDFDITGIVIKIIEFGRKDARKIRITPFRAPFVFGYFNDNVLGKRNKLTINERANLFIQLLINPDENYLHPKKKETLVTKDLGEFKISKSSLNGLFNHYEGELYSPKEKEELTASVDTLIEDATRRSKGEFFTPAIFVNEADKYISNAFGDDWKDKYVVWDCAWGTGNLTRDYKFRELYCSTIEQSDIDTANQMGYNPEAVKFQFDFLNDPDEKLPDELRAALSSGKEIIFFINPPYGMPTNDGKRNKVKAGSCATLVADDMKDDDFGGTGQLYAQFLYRMWKYNVNNNIHICCYTMPLYKTGPSFKKFRSNFYEKFRHESGFLFNASHFGGTSDTWGIDFSIWKSGIEDRNSLTTMVVNAKGIFIYDVQEKELWNMDNGKPLNKWIKQKPKIIEFPKLSSALKIKDANTGSEMDEKSFSNLVSSSNNIATNSQDVFIINGGKANSGGGKFFINKETFDKCVTLFTARRCIQDNWINHNDEYSQPTDLTNEFYNDSMVYALFNTKSNQSSLRQVSYKNKLWDIKNEFFWMSNKQMLELAEKYNYDELYQDAKTDTDRFVYKKLQDIELSDEAQNVMTMAIKLVVKSMKERKLGREEWHLQSWDAGYAQLKLVWKEYFKDDFDMFRALYKDLENKLIPQVYEFGFLRR